MRDAVPQQQESDMEEMNLVPTLAEANLPVPAQQIPSRAGRAVPAAEAEGRGRSAAGLPSTGWYSHWESPCGSSPGATGAGSCGPWAACRPLPWWHAPPASREGLSKVLRYTPFGRGISACPPCDQNAQAKR